MRMKKTITMLMALAFAMGSMAAISEKYNQGYDLESLPLNTAKNETNISLFANNQLMFLLNGETAFLSPFTEQQDSLLQPVKDKALTNLKIKGSEIDEVMVATASNNRKRCV